MTEPVRTRDEILRLVVEYKRGSGSWRKEFIGELLAENGLTAVPIEPTEAITDAIYDAETRNCTSPEVYKAIIKAAAEG